MFTKENLQNNLNFINDLKTQLTDITDNAKLPIKDKDNINSAIDLLKEYIKLDLDSKLIHCIIPMYSIVYVVYEDRNFDYESGKQPLCENPLVCNPNCELNGKECKLLPMIQQKIYAPNSIWFTHINETWGKTTFGTFKEAVKYINSHYGLDFCKNSGLPIIDPETDNLVLPNVDISDELRDAYNNEEFGKPVLDNQQN